MQTLTARISRDPARAAVNFDGKKERVDQLRVVVFQDGELHDAVDVRLWMGRAASASTHYCSVWARPAPGFQPRDWRTGHGKAGGYGYHRASAAMGAAVSAAGFELSAPIEGVGESAMESAALALAAAMGWTGPMRVFN